MSVRRLLIGVNGGGEWLLSMSPGRYKREFRTWPDNSALGILGPRELAGRTVRFV